MAAFGSIIMQNIGGRGRSLSLSLPLLRVCFCARSETLLAPPPPAAMSSYLFIVKYELPEVIRTFLALEESSGWVLVPFSKQQQADGADPLTSRISPQ